MHDEWDESVRFLIKSGVIGDQLAACFKESNQAFLLGLRQVVDTGGGIGMLSAQTELNREHLYRALSAYGNPKLSSLRLIFEALGLRLSFEPAQAAAEDERPPRDARQRESSRRQGRR